MLSAARPAAAAYLTLLPTVTRSRRVSAAAPPLASSALAPRIVDGGYTWRSCGHNTAAAAGATSSERPSRLPNAAACRRTLEAALTSSLARSTSQTTLIHGSVDFVAYQRRNDGVDYLRRLRRDSRRRRRPSPCRSVSLRPSSGTLAPPMSSSFGAMDETRRSVIS